ncbi:major facilitator superfamily domain-containing protein [Dichotomocladium elegans]|nr:major facilitator superfamily domain-containing protein [Dichotomocladium elegans]
MIIIGDVVPIRDRGKYQSIIALCWATGSILGPLLGGVLAEKASWRWIFFINIPIAIVSWVLLAIFLHLDEHVDGEGQNEQNVSISRATFRQQWKRLDIMGAFLFTLSMLCFLLATQWGGRRYAWGSPVIIWLYCGFLLIISLTVIRWLRYGNPRARDDPREGMVAVEPMIPLHLFYDRKRMAIYIMNIATSAAMFINIFYLPIYFQVAHGDSPSMAGVEVLPYLLPIDFVSMASGFAVSLHRGCYKYMFWIGTAMVAIGGGLQSTLSLGSGEASQICFLMITGTGIGFCIQNVYVAAQETAGPEDLAAAISLISFFGYFGFASGVAVGGAVFNHALEYYLRSTTPLTDGMMNEALQSPEFLQRLADDPPLYTLVQMAYGSALRWTFLTVAACGTLAFGFSSLALVTQKRVQTCSSLHPQEMNDDTDSRRSSL